MKTRITVHQTKLGVRCERGLQPCAKNFRTFEGGRMTWWIIQSVIIVWITVYIMGFVRWRAMPSSRTRTKRRGDFTRKTLNTYKACYTSIHAKDNEIHSHSCLVKCHTLVSNEVKTKRRMSSIQNQFSRGKTEQMSSHPTETLQLKRPLQLPCTKYTQSTFVNTLKGKRKAVYVREVIGQSPTKKRPLYRQARRGWYGTRG